MFFGAFLQTSDFDSADVLQHRSFFDMTRMKNKPKIAIGTEMKNLIIP